MLIGYSFKAGPDLEMPAVYVVGPMTSCDSYAGRGHQYVCTLTNCGGDLVLSIALF